MLGTPPWRREGSRAYNSSAIARERERKKERKRGKQKETYINCKADTFVQLYRWIELRRFGSRDFFF